ncbi:MAG: helix-turn-helix domain-containing protein, partial [Endozoicomonadaceae bacterium]|nr:helix-turn-helix domain-containing protein [Endozoicomonadaceae bacterium]
MPKQNTHYKQVTLAQRYQISAHRQAGYSLRAIGELIGIDHSTISRELKRNSVNGKYLPEHAQNTSVERKNTALKFSKKNENT